LYYLPYGQRIFIGTDAKALDDTIKSGQAFGNPGEVPTAATMTVPFGRLGLIEVPNPQEKPKPKPRFRDLDEEQLPPPPREGAKKLAASLQSLPDLKWRIAPEPNGLVLSLKAIDVKAKLPGLAEALLRWIEESAIPTNRDGNGGYEAELNIRSFDR
jgi:hypothetical protein